MLFQWPTEVCNFVRSLNYASVFSDVPGKSFLQCFDESWFPNGHMFRVVICMMSCSILSGFSLREESKTLGGSWGGAECSKGGPESRANRGS